MPKKITYGYTFAVEAISEIEGEMCYGVRVELVTIDGKEIKPSPRRYEYFYRIFNRADDCTLKMIQRFEKRTGKPMDPQKYRRGPVDATNQVGFLPLAFPVFSPEAQEYGPPDTAEPNAPIRRNRPQFWQKHQFSKGLWTVNDSEKSPLEVSIGREDSGGKMNVRRIEQTWIKGMPWPVHAKYINAPNPDLSAKLVRVNGDLPYGWWARGELATLGCHRHERTTLW